MEAKDFYTMFDDFIYAPSLDKELSSEWLKANKGSKVVYTVFDRSLTPIYVGGTTNLGQRLSSHRTREELSKMLDDVVFVGIKKVEDDVFKAEKSYIHRLEPKLNKYLYLV